jgi:hypothetical protein
LKTTLIEIVVQDMCYFLCIDVVPLCVCNIMMMKR